MRTTRIIAITGAALVALGGSGAMAVATPHSSTAPSAAQRSSAGADSRGSSDGQHGLGLDVDAVRADRAARGGRLQSGGALLPVRSTKDVGKGVDLTQYALPPGYQGKVGSCVTWASGYSAYGVLMNQQKIQGAPMAPMFIYSQLAKGNDKGTTLSRALPMLQKQGIDTKAHYKPGDTDFTTQPTDEERKNAAHYKLSGFQELSQDQKEGRKQIEAALDQGLPVTIGMELRKNFLDMSPEVASSYSYMPDGPRAGGHATTIIGYNDKGVKLVNSWGPQWGDKGFYTLSWESLFMNLLEVYSVGKVAYTP